MAKTDLRRTKKCVAVFPEWCLPASASGHLGWYHLRWAEKEVLLQEYKEKPCCYPMFSFVVRLLRSKSRWMRQLIWTRPALYGIQRFQENNMFFVPKVYSLCQFICKFQKNVQHVLSGLRHMLFFFPTDVCHQAVKVVVDSKTNYCAACGLSKRLHLNRRLVTTGSEVILLQVLMILDVLHWPWTFRFVQTLAEGEFENDTWHLDD